jgi:alkanesulfonate monooxygenase SsuD/methylene tetrahydromethanopterin reductase-like flavin-dependent oxidoreductase (luciferase family)
MVPCAGSGRGALNNPDRSAATFPIMISGSGERKTLRLVAQYADACNVFGDADRVRHLLAVLDGHCEDVGRDPAEITKTRLGAVLIGRTREEEPVRPSRRA